MADGVNQLLLAAGELAQRIQRQRSQAGPRLESAREVSRLELELAQTWTDIRLARVAPAEHWESIRRRSKWA